MYDTREIAPQRRQPSLSSHDEATTRRLIELSRPPSVATGKIERFKGWTPAESPELQVEEIRGAGVRNAAARERLAREIQLTLGPGRNR